jgi:hypothetical protein
VFFIILDLRLPPCLKYNKGVFHVCSDVGTDDSSSVSWKPTRKVINYFDIAKGFTFFNSYLTYVKIEKK